MTLAKSKTGFSPIVEGLSDRQITLVCVVLSLAVFIVDIASLPLGVAAGIAYAPVVLVALWLPRSWQTFAVAGATTVLTLLGFAWSEPAGVPWMVVTNRLLALSVIWLIAFGGRWLIESKRRKTREKLRQAEREADRARNAKLRFLETASNDIRHHLQTLVLLNATLLKTVSDQKAQQMFVMQGDALSHLGDVMNSLLDISEIESGSVEPNLEAVELNSVLDDLREEFSNQAQAKDLVLEIDTTTEVLRTDRVLLTQALRSLVSNAVRYTHDGIVGVHCEREPGGLRVTVRDTGVGIERDHLVKIFDEFYRVEQDPSGRNAGLGLGLTIVEHIVDMLGFSMDVESRPGEGSSFSLLLPETA